MTRKNYNPPKIGEWILKRISQEEDRISVTGDLGEVFRHMVQNDGSLKAYFWYWFQVIISVPPFINYSMSWSFTMFKNYFKIALRSMRNHKGYSFINIAGLAIGIACGMLILLYVQYEFGYDSFHKDTDRIFRVNMEFMAKNQPVKYAAVTSPPVAPAILDNLPDVEFAVRITRRGGVVKFEERQFFEEGILFAEQSFFNVFTFPVIWGNSETALKEPYTAVLTESTAEKYFGSEDPVGKSISVNYQTDYLITGVIKDVPSNSHLSFDILFSFVTLEESFSNASSNEFWFSHGYNTYIKTKNENLSSDFENKLYNLSANLIGDFETQIGFQQKFFLQPLTDIYFSSGLDFETGDRGNKPYLYFFTVIALFILIIASINFMNLATARAAGRAREVGMRKVVGAIKKQLIYQFLGESILTTFISTGIALLIIVLCYPYFEKLTGKELLFNLGNVKTVLYILLIPLAVGILSGGYPAFFLSAFRPVDTLKGAFGHTKKGAIFRKGLVVFQFAISILLIIGTTIVSRQLNFMKNRDLGFDKEQIVVLSLSGTGEARWQYEILKNEFLKHSTIVSASASFTVPGRGPSSNAMLPEGYLNDQWQTFLINWTDYDYLETYKIEMAVGRYFSRDFKTDNTEAFILNEAVVKSLGWDSPEEAVGKTWMIGLRQKGKIIGVTKDYHFMSLHQQILPLVIDFDPSRFNFISLRFTTGSVSETLSFIEDKWKELLPGEPFSFFFLNEGFESQYRAEERAGIIFSIFTLMAIVIACLGLFGLASYTAQSRTKEIGIRRTLGASKPGILLLLSREFTKWVLLSNIIAWPVAYFVMNRWLQNFAYRINPEIWIFILSASIAFIIAVFTVSFQAVKAAGTNPVDALKYE